ncbi:MAG TPA: helix-turn-helix domain-containing protein [Streptosporangiaceae bacterium]|nr:helix-turn-helix domain-containing protein [Streptosporangiaceae bacterium]
MPPADWIERTRIIALSSDGLGVAAIAAGIGCHENTVRRWLHRFNAAGIAGLGNQPGAGRGTSFSSLRNQRMTCTLRHSRSSWMGSRRRARLTSSWSARITASC